MKLSREWLGEYTRIDASDKDYCDAMTMSGSKVEGWEVTGSEISNVVVGRVDSIERHTNSDHMWVCRVDVGGRCVQIVTGAQNVRAGDLVPVALDGSTLPGGVEIHTGKLRGELSEGMLCSLKELGLEQRDFPYAIEDGIFILEEDCAPGDDIRGVCGFGDSVVGFEITNNRPDCYSLIGLARESAAAFNKPLQLHEPVVKGGGPGVLTDLLKEITSTIHPDDLPEFKRIFKLENQFRSFHEGEEKIVFTARIHGDEEPFVYKTVETTSYFIQETGNDDLLVITFFSEPVGVIS